MSGRPVAAPSKADVGVVARGDVTLDAIHRRLAEFLARLPAASRSLLGPALLPAALNNDIAGTVNAGGAVSPCRNDFYWLLIPEWLAGSRDERLEDVLWAQYCIYSHFRVLDDVVDGDTDDPHLAVAAGVLATEASRTLDRHLAGAGSFWTGYLESIESTSHALIEIDRRQSNPRRDGESDVDDYAALSRCLTVATRAVLTWTGRIASWPRVSRLLDHLAVAGQVLDDFHDMRGDLASGRYNHAVWVMTRPVFGGSAEATEAIIASNLASTDRLSVLFAEIASRLAAAESLVVDRDPPELLDYVRRFGRTVDGLRRSVEASQRRLFPK